MCLCLCVLKPSCILTLCLLLYALVCYKVIEAHSLSSGQWQAASITVQSDTQKVPHWVHCDYTQTSVAD